MGFGDYTPASHSYKKPITKKQLLKLQESYKNADEISRQARELEEKEQKKASQEMEDLLSGLD
ncbi:MAG: hypothetical protein PHZ26_05975 [Candidatus Gracilibacteria bacterium]|nr:hypothetical protein [Candidatus Gracilibacteria bacterium]MDD2909261.1 hypothetical protein [Candidatus Gracilibacteria bacterium]